MRLVVDVNLPPAWVACLEAAGLDAVHWSSIGALDAPDTDLLAWAVRNNAVLMTCDLDFGAILAASGLTAPSVVQIRARDVMPTAIGQRIVAALGIHGRDLDSGALVSVDLDRARVRILPLRDRGFSE